jgi:hypothetical protein
MIGQRDTDNYTTSKLLLLLLYRLPYFVFCLLVSCALLRIRANFVTWPLSCKFARTLTRIEFNYSL